MSAFLDEHGLQRYNQKILNQISTEIARIVADAPGAYDTLQEIAAWISAHSDSATTMNQQINTNTQDISNLDSRVEEIENAYVKYNDIVDDLSSTDSHAPLSAKQGKVLDEKIDAVDEKINKLTDTETATVYTLSVESGLLCLDDGV